MNSIEATIRSTKTKGELNTLRKKVKYQELYMVEKMKTKKFQFQKKLLKHLMKKKTFYQMYWRLNIDGKDQNVLPREIKFMILLLMNQYILDFLRIVKGTKIILEIPVKFINNEKSPGLKRGGVLNIVRRKS